MKEVSLSFGCVGAEKHYFSFRVRWATDSHFLTYVGTLGRVHLARLLEILS